MLIIQKILTMKCISYLVPIFQPPLSAADDLSMPKEDARVNKDIIWNRFWILSKLYDASRVIHALHNDDIQPNLYRSTNSRQHRFWN